MAVGNRVRFEVFKRDKFACQYCGRTPPAVVLNADHVVPVSDGGPDTQDNLITACFECNSGKSNIPLGHVPASLAEQVAEAKERREQVEQFNRFLLEQREYEDGQVRGLGHYWFNAICREKDAWVFGASRVASIKTFLKKLPAARIMEAMDIANARLHATLERDEKAWKYFCGICWNMSRENDRK